MKKKLLVMTSFGPVPFDAVKEHLPKEIVEAVLEIQNKIENNLDEDSDKEEFYIKRIAEKKGWKYERMKRYLDDLESFYPAIVFSILLREIALYLDNKYEDTINKSKYIYVISSSNGKIAQIDKSSIKNYRNFAAFRTEADAKFAHRVLSKRIRRMFRGCGK